MPIYILTLCKIVPGEPMGYISDLLEDVFVTINDAEIAFNNLRINKLYFRKELWQKTVDGKRRLIMEERYVGKDEKNAG